MTNIDLYMDNSHQASVPYPFSSIDTSVNTDADGDADAPCGTALIVTRKMRTNVTQNIFSGMFHITTCRCGSRIWSRGGPGAEAESCRRSGAESREWSELIAAGVQGP